MNVGLGDLDLVFDGMVDFTFHQGTLAATSTPQLPLQVQASVGPLPLGKKL